MPYEVTVPPAVEPVSIAQFKRQSRLYADLTDEDPLLLAYLRAAREMIEAETGQACVAQTLVAYFDGFPRYCDDRPRELELPLAPAASVESVEYRDEDGTWVELASTEWELAGMRMPGRVLLRPDKSWPSDVYGSRVESVRVTYVAGRADVAKIPPMLEAAILLQADFFYTHRTPVTERKSYVMERGVRALVDLCRTRVAV